MGNFDYAALGKQYILEADVVRSHLKQLRKDCTASQGRINQLREINTQLREVGYDLIRRGN